MPLPKAEPRFSVNASCPDCGYEHIWAWMTRPVDGTTDRLTRRCLCPECGCWFKEDIRLVFQSANILRMRKDGREERRTESHHRDACPFCGKALEEDSPYFGDEEEVDYLRTKDVEGWTYPRVLYCLDCHADIRETYRMERTGAEVIRHGMGPKGAESCPECGALGYNYSLRKASGANYSVVCECHKCGCVYRLETKEEYNQTRVVADRDGWYADADYESLYFEPVAKIGGNCPMCEKGVIAASPDYVQSLSDPYRGLRGSRTVGLECLSCYTVFEDLYDTRVVSKKSVE